MKLGAAWIMVALVAGLAPALAQTATGGDPSDAASQLRLDRPVGGGGSGGGSGGSPAPAAPRASGLVTDVSAEDVVRIMRDVGFKSTTVETNKAGSYVKAQIDETDTFIFLENCNDGRCVSLLFTVYLGRQDSVDETFINDYNRNTIYTKLAKDKDGELQLMLPASLYKGVSEEHVRSLGELWISVFKEALEYKPSGK
ncbi:YbjN domain-containing protein [Enterovirga rhinocerotis]|uniref:Putative sensory transduction regulator n=1 Tax=Enterovirga rhinocerotis TaxID=1339210 RepID=A0A4R7BUZ8_9HYPH|nr:YbjN domain-containing protein [Enterovirga rhinocerotis]TDR89223.1 putative sensory transduction regulator [Enterovirga rhinocerotis]